MTLSGGGVALPLALLQLLIPVGFVKAFALVAGRGTIVVIQTVLRVVTLPLFLLRWRVVVCPTVASFVLGRGGLSATMAPCRLL